MTTIRSTDSAPATPVATQARPTLERLTRKECYQLLASVNVGRLAVAIGPDTGPIVLPVNFALDGEGIVFRTGPGTKRRAIRGREVSFEVDVIDPFHRTGWSVLVRGNAYDIVGDTAARVDKWVGGEDDAWIRIEPVAVEGRRIVPPDTVLESAGYL